jgi:hypothetical protein
MSQDDKTAAKPVTVDNFVRAETDMTMKRYVAMGGFGKIIHVREPASVEKQDVIRMNRDTLYSLGVFDLTSPLAITKPEPKGRYQSMMLVSEDHYVSLVEYGAGVFNVTQEMTGTRYVFIIFRTFMDPARADDIKAANALQDGISTQQADAGAFDIPDWDEGSLKTVRDAVNVLASTKEDTSRMFGARSEVDPIDHLLGTAYGWGGLPKAAAMYVNGVPEHNDGRSPYALTVKDAPVDGFWSVTVYNAEGYMEPNHLGAYSFNNVTGAKNADGSTTVHFGGDPQSTNYLPITAGWNYIARLYRPRRELLDGTWTFPEAESVG